MKCRGSNPPAPANQSGLPLTVLRHPGISAVARYFAGEKPVSTDGFGGFNGLRGRCLQGPISTNGFAGRDTAVRAAFADALLIRPAVMLPKKRGPFHVVPVMARAILERLR